MIPFGETVVSLSSLLCLSLLHFLWQAAAIALAAVAAGLAMRRRSAQAEYVALVVGLVFLPCAFAATLVWQASRVSPAADPITVPVATTVPITVAAPTSAPTDVQPRLNYPIAATETEPPAIVEPVPATDAAPATLNSATLNSAMVNWRPVAPWIGAIYLIGVLAMCIRLLAGLSGARRLCGEAARVKDPGVLESLAQQCRRVGLRIAPPIAYCRSVSVPTLVGIFGPAILLPLSAVSGLSPAELESILLHELVHIRRYDHLLNLGQRLVEAAFFFHPAVWFLSRRITVVREHCCDDAVLALGAQRAVYVESLMRVAELSVAAEGMGRPATVVGLHAADKPSRLRQRIARLLDQPGRTALRLKPAALLLVGALLVGSLTTPLLLSALAAARQHGGQDIVAANDSANADGKTTSESKNAAAAAKTPPGQPLHFSGLVDDKFTQKPVAGAIVTLYRMKDRIDEHGGISQQGKPEDIVKPEEIVTDASGRYSFTIAADLASNPAFVVATTVRHPRYAPIGLGDGPYSGPDGWIGNQFSSVLGYVKSGHAWPEKIELLPGETVAAVIADPQGKPLADCPISFSSATGARLRGESDRWKKSVAVLEAQAVERLTGIPTGKVSTGSTTTDANGRFSFQAILGADTAVFGAEPKDYAILWHDCGRQRGDLGTFRVHPGTRLVGTVVDASGKPLGAANLTVELITPVGELPLRRRGETTADKTGHFAFEPLGDGTYELNVLKDGWYDGRFIQTRVVASAEKPVAPLDLRPPPMRTLRIHFADLAGKPLVGRHSASIYSKPEFYPYSTDYEYLNRLHWAFGDATAQVPKRLTQIELHCGAENGNDLFYRLGEHGDWKMEGNHADSIRLDGLKGDLTEITVVEAKLPQLVVHVVGPDGKSIAKFSPRIQYKDPTVKGYVQTPIRRAKQVVAKIEIPLSVVDVTRSMAMLWTPPATIPSGQWTSEPLQPDQEFTVTVNAAGHQPASQTLKLAEGENREITLKLSAEAKKSSSDAPVKTGIAKGRPGDVSAASPVALAADGKTTSEKKAVAAAAKTPAAQPLHFSGIVIEKFTLKPIAGAIVTLHRFENDGPIGDVWPTMNGFIQNDDDGLFKLKDIVEPQEIVTDASGHYGFTISPAEVANRELSIGFEVRKSGYVSNILGAEKASWFLPHDARFPWFEIIEMIPGETVSGVIADPQGRPLANCLVEAASTAEPKHARQAEKGRSRPHYDQIWKWVATDSSGRFSLDVIKRAETAELWAMPKNFAILWYDIGTQRGDLGVIRVQPGTRIVGTVADKLGKPLAGALLRAEPDRRDIFAGWTVSRDARTDAHGRFALDPVEDGNYQVTVLDERFMPVRVKTSVLKKPVVAIDFRPPPLTTVRVHYVDRAGKPLSERERIQPSEPSTVGDNLRLTGTKGKISYGTGFHWTPGEATARVPKGLEHVVLKMMFPAERDDLVFWRVGERGDFHWSNYQEEFPIGSLDGDVADVTILGIKVARLAVHAVGPDGKPRTELWRRIKYKDPAIGSHAVIPLLGGAKGDIPMNEFRLFSMNELACLPDQEFTATAEAEGFQPASQTLKLAEGENREITLKLSAEVKKSSSDAPIKTGVANERAGDVSAASPVALAADGNTTSENKNAAAAAQTPPAQPLHFSGIVVDKITQKPIAGATVSILRKATTKLEQVLAEDVEKPQEIVTDTAGRYEFTIAAERATDNRFLVGLGAKAPAYAPKSTGYDRVSSMLDDQRKGHPWFGKLELFPGESVSGIIADPNGKPLANCPISFDSFSMHSNNIPNWMNVAEKDRSSGETTTDANGRFSFRAIRGATNVIIEAEPKDFGFLWHNAGSTRGDLGVLRVPPGTRLAGTVVDELGKPVSGVHLTAKSHMRWNGLRATATRRKTTTDDHGRFVFDPVEDGLYDLTVEDERFLPMPVAVSTERPAPPIDFHPPPLTTVRIHFVDRAGKPSPVRHSPELFAPKGNTSYHSRLHWTLGEATARVPKRLEHVQLQNLIPAGYFALWRFGERGDLKWAQDGAAPVELGSLGDGPTEITVIESKRPELVVHAIGPDGKPIARFSPWIEYTDPAVKRQAHILWPNMIKGMKGDAPLSEHPPGRWIAWLLEPDQEFTVTIDAAGYQSASQTLKLAEGENREITLRLEIATKKSSIDAPIKTGVVGTGQKPVGTPVSGTVTDPRGKWLAGALVTLESEKRNGPLLHAAPRRTATTDEHGHFAFDRVEDGAYRLTVDDRRFIPIMVEVSARKPVGSIDLRVPIFPNQTR
jgi:beta-lactamase regulating signal transducer with metallopeptidase domain/uncharacterized GH25 family protein